MTQTTKTLAEVQADFRRAGISVTDWAKANGFNRMTVVDVMRGRRTGLRGEAHLVAVALGIKQGEVIDVADFKPRPQPQPKPPLKHAA